MAQYRLQYGKLGWRGRIGLVVAIAVGLAAAIALIILSLGLAIVLFPIVAVALVVGRWRLRKMMAEARTKSGRADAPPAAQRTIETDYSVIDEKDRR